MIKVFCALPLLALFKILLLGEFFSLFANDLYVFFNFSFTDNFYVQQKQPFFDSHQNTNITVLEKESVLLKCVVRNKGNKTVSRELLGS